MRRIYDNKNYETIATEIMKNLDLIKSNSKLFSRKEWGMERAQISLIKNDIEEAVGIKLTRPTHAYGIGNNNAYEIVDFDPQREEEQICGLLHLNKSPFGSVYAYITSIDGDRNKDYPTVVIHGR